MKLKLTLLCLGVFLVSCLQQAIAQGLPVSGTIKKSTGELLEGATITEKGTKNSTFTNAQGRFSITAPKGARLVVTYSGMATQEKLVSSAGELNFSLEDAANDLSDVVVVGYGVQKITKVSGAISTIKSADIAKITPVRVEEALQGRAAGVNVIQNGSPGSKPTVLVRGIPSFSGTDPVVIIDGVPQTLSDFNSINAADIEAISVLKDAAATAIYGVKGGNGVIVVTTKSGRKNLKTDISINSNYGVQEIINKIGVLNASEYAAIVNEGSVASGGNIIFPDLAAVGVGTDWQDEVFKTAPMMSHNISARGGGEKASYFLSGGYLSQGGIVGGYDKSRFNRANVTANLNFDLTSKLKVILNTSYANQSSKGVQENGFNSIIGSALNFDPTVPVLNTVPNTVGKYGFSNLIQTEIFNPLTKLDNTYNKNIGNKLYGKLEFQYEVIKNFKISTRFGYTKYDATSKGFTPLVFYGPLNQENTMNADGTAVSNTNADGITTSKHNSVSHTKSSNFNYTYELFGNYNFKVGDNHNFETVAGLAIAKSSGNEVGASREDVPFNSWEYADFTSATATSSILGAGTPTPVLYIGSTGYAYQYFRKNLSYFGRVNYDYNDKYLASFSVRRDGSYAFGKDNKFGNFYAGSLGWLVSKETFFHSNLINNFKIRGSYGVTGNENVSPQFVSIETGGPSYGGTANSNGYTFGGAFFPGSTVASASNDLLRWERQKQLNVGFDISILKNKLSLSADYYQKKVDGLLFTPSASLYLGTVPLPTANIGNTKTSGVDLTLAYTDHIGKDFNISSAVTFTTSKNEVTATNADGTAIVAGGDFFNGQSQLVTRFEKGFTPGYFYGYKTDGLFQTAGDIAKAASQPGAQPGDIRFADVNGDGVITAADQTKIGDPFPEFTLGWNVNLEYKGLDLTVFTYASVGNDIYRAYERNMNYGNKFQNVLDRWTGPNTTNDADNPRYSFSDANSNVRASDRYIEDGSFIKIKNIQIGYNFNIPALKKAVSKLRVYVQVKNAFVFTNYTGYDPEIPGAILNTGVDRGSYPQARYFAAGLDVKF